MSNACLITFALNIVYPDEGEKTEYINVTTQAGHGKQNISITSWGLVGPSSATSEE